VDPLVGFMEEKYSIIYFLLLQIFQSNMYDDVEILVFVDPHKCKYL
jgi:hypothetical protein